MQLAGSDLSPFLSLFPQWSIAVTLSLPTTELLLLAILHLGLLFCTRVRKDTACVAATSPSVRQTASGQRNRVASVSACPLYGSMCELSHYSVDHAMHILLLYLPTCVLE